MQSEFKLAMNYQIVVLLGLLSASWGVPRNVSLLLHPAIGGRIVGGDEADISNFPYQAALLRNNLQICGGAIIGPSTILTAAHCVVPSVISSVVQLSVRVGSSQWRSGGQQIQAQEIIYHEDYQDCDTCSPDYDIAIIKLTEPINTPKARMVALVNARQKIAAGTNGVVSGWGITAFGSNVGEETLRSVEVPVVAERRCRATYGSIITERTLCAGFTAGGRDACQGDSGGPYVVNGALAGVVSFGFRCAMPLFPGVYANVATYRQWITEMSGI